MAKTLTNEQIDALQRYAEANGRTWKSQLLDDWMNGRSTGELQVLRNTLGPSWLDRFSLRDAIIRRMKSVYSDPSLGGRR